MRRRKEGGYDHEVDETLSRVGGRDMGERGVGKRRKKWADTSYRRIECYGFPYCKCQARQDFKASDSGEEVRRFVFAGVRFLFLGRIYTYKDCLASFPSSLSGGRTRKDVCARGS